MNLYDIVYIKGNPNSGSKEQHEQIDAEIVNLISSYNYKIISSEQKNIDFFKHLPKAIVYIGFSRGSRYLKKLPTSSLKISIGGIKGANIYQFLNDGDEILKGDLSLESMKAHFIIKEEDKNLIKNLIKNKI